MTACHYKVTDNDSLLTYGEGEKKEKRGCRGGDCSGLMKWRRGGEKGVTGGIGDEESRKVKYRKRPKEMESSRKEKRG